jgi:hypothetical protein
VRDELLVVETDLARLAKTLAALITHHEENPALASQLARLRAAHDAAKRAEELVRQYRERQA